MKYFVAMVTMILALGAAAAENAVVSNAQSIARSWLALTDAGKYSESRDSAAVLFRAAMTKPDWEKSLKSARSPLGALKGRTVKSATYARTLPGAPEQARQHHCSVVCQSAVTRTRRTTSLSFAALLWKTK